MDNDKEWTFKVSKDFMYSIPEFFREKLGLKIGDTVVFIAMDDGNVRCKFDRDQSFIVKSS